MRITTIFFVAALFALSCIGTAAAAHSTPAKSADRQYSAKFLPRWLPNIHRRSEEACDAISDFRSKSAIVQKLVEEAKLASAATHITVEDIGKKIKRASDAHPSKDLAKSVGYQFARLQPATARRATGSSPASPASRALAPPPRLLCLGFSHQANMRGVEEQGLARQYRHWAKRCDDVLLFSAKPAVPGVPREHVREIHPIQGDGTDNVWQRFRLACAMLADPTQDGPILRRSDYVVVFTDDAFFSLPNTKAMLMEPQVAAANKLGSLLILGHRMSDGPKNTFVSNMGYVMNKQLFRVAADLVNTPACDPMARTGSDDIQLGKCLGAYGVVAFDAADELGSDRFVMWALQSLADQVERGFPQWYLRYRGRPVPKSLAVISQFPAAIHGVGNDAQAKWLEGLIG